MSKPIPTAVFFRRMAKATGAIMLAWVPPQVTEHKVPGTFAALAGVAFALIRFEEDTWESYLGKTLGAPIAICLVAAAFLSPAGPTAPDAVPEALQKTARAIASTPWELLLAATLYAATCAAAAERGKP